MTKIYTMKDIFGRGGNPKRGRPVSNPFVRACAEGRIEDVRQMLAAGEGVDQVDMGLAMKDGGIMTDFYEPNSIGATGLQMAAKTRNLEMLKLLHQAGADPLKTHPYVHGENVDTIVFAVGAAFTDGLRYLVDECGYKLPTEDDGSISNSVLFDGLRGDGCTMDFVRYVVEEKKIDPCGLGNCSTCSTKDRMPIILANRKEVPDDVFEYFLSRIRTPNYPADSQPAYKLNVHTGAEQDTREILGEAESEKFSLSGYFGDSAQNHATLLNQAVSHKDDGKIDLLLARGADPRYKGRGTRNAFDVLESDSLSLGVDEDWRNRIHMKLSGAVLKIVTANRPAPGTPGLPGPR